MHGYRYIYLEKAADIGVFTRMPSADLRTHGSARAWLKLVLELCSSRTSVGSKGGRNRQTRRRKEGDANDVDWSKADVTEAE